MGFGTVSTVCVPLAAANFLEAAKAAATERVNEGEHVVTRVAEITNTEHLVVCQTPREVCKTRHRCATRDLRGPRSHSISN